MHPNVIRYGEETPLPQTRILRAGPLSLLLDGGDLRYIRLGESELIRRIYVAVRDQSWGTAATQLSDVDIQSTADSFHVSFRADSRLDAIHFRWIARIAGDSAGRITFEFDGEAAATFQRNRLGFCVLHPIAECAGIPCTIHHCDGTSQGAAFPGLVAPQLQISGKPTPCAPFSLMRGLSYEVLPGIRAELTFDGDAFEMEDQRNWTDASFKTYCTPLALPFPVEIAKGTRIRQKITLSLDGQAPCATGSAAGPAIVLTRPIAPPRPLPRIGLGIASHGEAPSTREIDLLKQLGLSHLRAEVRPSRQGWQDDLAKAARQSSDLGCPLELVVVLSDSADAQLRAFAEAIARIRPSIASILLWHAHEAIADNRLARLAREMLPADLGCVPIGIGSKADFTELNRAWPEAPDADFLSFAANPQVHASDNASIAETPTTFESILQTARRHTDLPLAISPLTLKRQSGPDPAGSAPGQLRSAVDPRQMSLFCGGWTLACIGHIAQHDNVHHVSLFQTTGALGVVERESGNLPGQFASRPGDVFPVYHVLADLAEMPGAQVEPIRSSDPLKIEALSIRAGGRLRLLLANLTNDPQTIDIGAFGPADSLRILDEQTHAVAAGSPESFRRSGSPHMANQLTLRPYALACVDYGRNQQLPLASID